MTFDAGNAKSDGILQEAKTKSHVDLAPTFKGTYAERGNEYATMTM
jgi:hypothetical protein